MEAATEEVARVAAARVEAELLAAARAAEDWDGVVVATGTVAWAAALVALGAAGAVGARVAAVVAREAAAAPRGRFAGSIM